MTIRIDEVLGRDLKQYAAATQRSRGYIVREALRRQLALARFRTVREEIIPLAEQIGLMTDEEMFKTIGDTVQSERLP